MWYKMSKTLYLVLFSENNQLHFGNSSSASRPLPGVDYFPRTAQHRVIYSVHKQSSISVLLSNIFRTSRKRHPVLSANMKLFQEIFGLRLDF